MGAIMSTSTSIDDGGEREAEEDEDEKRKKLKAEGIKAFTSSFLPMAKIPWIKSQKEPALKFHDTNFFHMILQVHKSEFSQLVRLVNELSLFYHPQRLVYIIVFKYQCVKILHRYYNMDCMALYEQSDKSLIWSHFKNLLILNCWKGLEVLGLVESTFDETIEEEDEVHAHHAIRLFDLRCDFSTKRDLLFNVRARLQLLYYNKITLMTF